MLQCVAVCCSVLQGVAVCCSVLRCVAVCCNVLQCVAVCCSELQCVAVCSSVSLTDILKCHLAEFYQLIDMSLKHNFAERHLPEFLSARWYLRTRISMSKMKVENEDFYQYDDI